MSSGLNPPSRMMPGPCSLPSQALTLEEAVVVMLVQASLHRGADSSSMASILLVLTNRLVKCSSRDRSRMVGGGRESSLMTFRAVMKPVMRSGDCSRAEQLMGEPRKVSVSRLHRAFLGRGPRVGLSSALHCLQYVPCSSSACLHAEQVSLAVRRTWASSSAIWQHSILFSSDLKR